MTLVDELSYDAERIGDKPPFTYGVKKGSGLYNEPFVVCFTLKHMLTFRDTQKLMLHLLFSVVHRQS